jgi:hypothetical protein
MHDFWLAPRFNRVEFYSIVVLSFLITRLWH